MSNEKISHLLERLREEIGDTDVDEQTRSLLRNLESDIDRLLESNDAPDVSASLSGSANQLEASFAASHPVAERLVRELLDTFAKMGI